MARNETELLAMGERIRELRASHGYKQQWIADQIGVKLRTYQFWQAGQSPPEQENLEKLAKLFGVTPTYILKGETPDPFVGVNSSDLESRLDQIERKLDNALLVLSAPESEAAAEVVADVVAQLEAAAESPPSQADDQPETPPEDQQQGSA